MGGRGHLPILPVRGLKNVMRMSLLSKLNVLRLGQRLLWLRRLLVEVVVMLLLMREQRHRTSSIY